MRMEAQRRTEYQYCPHTVIFRHTHGGAVYNEKIGHIEIVRLALQYPRATLGGAMSQKRVAAALRARPPRCQITEERARANHLFLTNGATQRRQRW